MTKQEHRQNTKLQILNAGRDLVLKQGFNYTGISQILKRVGIPKGSFYHYFKSKEDFGLQLIELDRQEHENLEERFFEDSSLPHVNRLRALYRFKATEFKEQGFKGGCLAGNLAQEMASESPEFRKVLQENFERWRKVWLQCLQQAEQAGEISPLMPVEELVEFFLFALEGAILRAKVTQCMEPLDLFERLFFEVLLQSKVPPAKTS